MVLARGLKRMKAILVIDIDEKYINSFGTEIQFINQKYNCKWKLKPMPERVKENVMKGMPNEEWQMLYDEGWNDCIKEIEK